MRRTKAGMTLFELIISIGILTIVGLGAIGTYSAMVTFQTKTWPRMLEAERGRRIETQIRTYLSGAFLGAGTAAGSNPTYFIAEATGESAWTSGVGNLSDSLSFTTLGLNPPGTVLEATGEFQDLNERFGPQGGILEASFEATAIGNAGDAQGPFLRTQRPADGDPYQGGWEEVLDANLAGLNFEFWDGTTWVEEWNSSQMDPPRLPAAVRVYYALTGEEESVRSFVVRLPLSDVTPQNPAGVIGEAP